jgi:hypothetical protein
MGLRNIFQVRELAPSVLTPPLSIAQIPASKKPHRSKLRWGLSYFKLLPQTLISTSTPLGSSSFIRASTVFDEVEKMSTRRL